MKIKWRDFYLALIWIHEPFPQSRFKHRSILVGYVIFKRNLLVKIVSLFINATLMSNCVWLLINGNDEIVRFNVIVCVFELSSRPLL
jgi:hypothetical protein